MIPIFDATVQAIGLEIETVEDEAVVFSIILGLNVPAGQGPDGQIIMGQLPSGVVRFRLGRDAAIEHGKQLMEAGESLAEPKPQSDLVVAQSLQGVDQAAQMNARFRQGS